jgi:uncharacterized membrane protein
MKLSWRVELPALLVMAAMFAGAIWAWPQLPERIPTHWNLRGEVDGWGNKFVGLALLPVTTICLYGMMLLTAFVDPGKDNYQNFSKAFGVIRLALVLLFAVIYSASLFAAFGYAFNMTTVILCAMGFLFIVLGNYMSKIRPNWFVGVRTPWTLSSRLSWDKTHRLAGWLFMPMGAMFLVVAWFQNVWTFTAMLVVDGLCVLWMVAYSYLVYRTDPNRTTPAGTSPSNEEA